MKSFICILLALFQFTIFTAIGAVGEPPLHELPLNLSVSDAGVRDSTSRMSVIEYKFKPKSLILPASLITVGAIGTAIDGMNDFHLFSRRQEDTDRRLHGMGHVGLGFCLRPDGEGEA